MNHSLQSSAPGSDRSLSDDELPSGSSTGTTPPTPDDIDRWQYHVNLQEFGQDLQSAAKAVFPNTTRSRYKRVFVLMICWDDEDPQLPVSLEISRLFRVFREIYNFEAEIWKIPDANCHAKVTQKILNFVGNDDKEHLKIVYYAGHGRLTENRLLMWTSWRNKTVKWSGVQNILEEAQSDVLILLDCCASGTVGALGGNGVTELIAACPYNAIANGVGQYSFTNAIVSELEFSRKSSFTTAELYTRVFSRIQGRLPEDGKERHPPPIHLRLTQDTHQSRSIVLSKCLPDVQSAESMIGSIALGKRPEGLPTSDPGDSCSRLGSAGDQHYQDLAIPSPMIKVPRLAFAIRLRDDLKPSQLKTDLFVEWLRNMPAIAEEVKVEAGFQSFSSLLIISLPLSLSAYLPRDRAIISLGPILSSNLIQPSVKFQHYRPRIIYGGRESNGPEQSYQTGSVVIIPNQNSRRSKAGRAGPTYHSGTKFRSMPIREPANRNVTSMLSIVPEDDDSSSINSDLRLTTPVGSLSSTRRKDPAPRKHAFPPSPPSSIDGSPRASRDVSDYELQWD